MARPAGHPDNALISSLGSHASWANTADPSARTKPARDAFGDRFVREARERFGDLPADELARRAEHLRRAYFARLALKSAQTRRKRKAAAEAEPSPKDERMTGTTGPPGTRIGPTRGRRAGSVEQDGQRAADRLRRHSHTRARHRARGSPAAVVSRLICQPTSTPNRR